MAFALLKTIHNLHTYNNSYTGHHTKLIYLNSVSNK